MPVPGDFVHLRALALGRVDLLFMKLAAFRPEDIVDIVAMGTAGFDVSVAEGWLRKVAAFDKKKAHVVGLFLSEKGLL